MSVLCTVMRTLRDDMLIGGQIQGLVHLFGHDVMSSEHDIVTTMKRSIHKKAHV